MTASTRGCWIYWPTETLLSRHVIEAYARKHRLCPFEFSLDAAYAADAVICDYNYIFDPRVSLKRQLAEQKKQTALLIDEAHNLVDRAREMFSCELNKSQFLAVQRQFKGVSPAVHQAAKAVNDYFIALRKQSEHRQRVDKLLRSNWPNLLKLSLCRPRRNSRLQAMRRGHRLLLDTYFSALGRTD